jgi:signal transduction histidine kinase/CheY-like chemotaxis protein
MPQEIARAQAHNAYRQMPLGVFGNGGACLITVAILHDTFTWSELIYLPIVMGVLQFIPVSMLLGRLRHRTDPQWAAKVLRRVVADSGMLGMFWACAMIGYLPYTDHETKRLLLVCSCFLGAGAAGVLQAVPRAFALYAGPMYAIGLYFAINEWTVDGGILAGMIAMMQVAVLWMLWINHSNFLELLSRNRKLDELRREAEAARLAETAFVENLNHEIRNAVSGVVGYFDIALESRLSEHEQLTLMTRARDASSMLLTLLSDLLDVARLNAGRVPLTIQPFDLREVVRLSIVSTSAAIRRRPISVVCAIDDSVPSWLDGDAGRVRQIIVNLVSNAIKVMQRGTVVIQASYRKENGQGWLDVAVIDDGPGIPHAQQQVMFERFSRLSDFKTSGARAGTTGWGLGLSISASLIELMHGRITVHSMPGQGATFRINLPLAHVETPVPRETLASAAASVVPLRRDISVLIVDDMPMNLLVLSKMLESLDCRVTVAEHGLDAVSFCAAERYDLVLMDVDMAEMDGVEATRRIRALPAPFSDVPIIAVTGFASPEQVARIHASGMNAHALKPMRKATAAQLLANWVPQATPGNGDAQPSLARFMS